MQSVSVNIRSTTHTTNTTEGRPAMAMIYVRTRPGRRAYYEGRVIPQDKFIAVLDSPYIRRLLDHWQDIELEPDADAAKGRKRLPGRSPSPPTAPRPTDN